MTDDEKFEFARIIEATLAEHFLNQGESSCAFFATSTGWCAVDMTGARGNQFMAADCIRGVCRNSDTVAAGWAGSGLARIDDGRLTAPERGSVEYIQALVVVVEYRDIRIRTILQKTNDSNGGKRYQRIDDLFMTEAYDNGDDAPDLRQSFFFTISPALQHVINSDAEALAKSNQCLTANIRPLLFPRRH